MPRALRAELFDPSEISILHIYSRCVRRAFLTGIDEVSGKDYSFRREWIRIRMERLASVFAMDILSYAILSNHIHLIARNRPDVVKTWSDREVALRWLKLFPGQRMDEQLADPTDNKVDALARDKPRLAQIRSRLSNPSWFMKALCEPIARIANKQDEVTGHFWEGRFKAQAITDEASLLACSLYVDLNPVRAAMAETPEKSVHTSAYDRIKSLQGATIASAAAELITIPTEEAGRIRRTTSPDDMRKLLAEAKKRRGPKIARDAWLAPLTINEKGQLGPQASTSGVRASDKGFLSLKLADYLKLLDWTSRQRSQGPETKAVVPKDLEPILKRIGIEGSMFANMVWSFRRYFGRGNAIGAPDSLREIATERGRSFIHGQRMAARCFTTVG
jgi:REP element-mobilizing transposase RayT